MSDLATSRDDIFEPNEEALISALRNQDDIPILMDIVADQVSSSVSQEVHFVRSLDDHKNAVQDDETGIPPVLVEKVSALSVSSPSQAQIAKAIGDVLEKRLPELVAEVIQALHLADAQNVADSSQTKDN